MVRSTTFSFYTPLFPRVPETGVSRTVQTILECKNTTVGYLLTVEVCVVRKSRDTYNYGTSFISSITLPLKVPFPGGPRPSVPPRETPPP